MQQEGDTADCRYVGTLLLDNHLLDSRRLYTSNQQPQDAWIGCRATSAVRT